MASAFRDDTYLCEIFNDGILVRELSQQFLQPLLELSSAEAGEQQQQQQQQQQEQQQGQ